MIFSMNKNGLGESLDSWIAKPFSSDMSVMQWAMFVGLLMLACVAWSRVIRLILDNA